MTLKDAVDFILHEGVNTRYQSMGRTLTISSASCIFAMPWLRRPRATKRTG